MHLNPGIKGFYMDFSSEFVYECSLFVFVQVRCLYSVSPIQLSSEEI